VKATDLRAAAALVIAGLAGHGQTDIYNVHFLDRGYFNLESRLIALGADVTRQ
ncbi:UDP-N-acetylglucosamine 1-carboxyvinyltransferase, partial [Desulforudis sp. 1190]